MKKLLNSQMYELFEFTILFNMCVWKKNPQLFDWTVAICTNFRNFIFPIQKEEHL
jgi:hypothetical protein